MSLHTFGGHWTEEKLDCLAKYLTAYRTIFTRNERARYFRTWYVDAFAGTGARSQPTQPDEQPLFGDAYEQMAGYREGSAHKALSLPDPFDHYLFIEASRTRLNSLRETIKANFNTLDARCELRQGDANATLQAWCNERDWSKDRAVVFLDPYGMQVVWNTVEVLASTKGVDLWYLFPLGIGVARLLTKDGSISDRWSARLTRLFGTADWRDRFYPSTTQTDLFGECETVRRDASEQGIAAFIHERLETCFEAVARGLVLRNSRANPLYLLCFAAANKRGATTALNIAQDILSSK